MKHGTLVIPVERARHFIDLIGRNCSMQFEDMNAQDMRRPYKKFVQRLDEMERILRFLFDELSKIPGTELKKNQIQTFLECDGEFKLDSVESGLKKLYDQFMRFKDNNAVLLEQLNAAVEERCVMQSASASLTALGRTAPSASHSDEFDFDSSRSLLEEDGGRGAYPMSSHFSNMAGVVLQSEQQRFAQTLFRATHGTVYTHFQQIVEPMKEPKTGKPVQKSVFVIYYQDTSRGGGQSAMAQKIQRICQSFGTTLYAWPGNRDEADRRVIHLGQTLEDKQRALEAFEKYMMNEASVMMAPGPSGNSAIEELRLFTAKEKAIYTQLNHFEGDVTLRANAWYPAVEEEHIRQLLIRQSTAQQSSAMLVSDRHGSKKNPPTYIRMNALTQPFQELVDTYGVPRYGEANPALLTVVTFPFMFGIMYGDIGHGLMLFGAGIWCIFNAEMLKYQLPAVYMSRYMIAMMGFFAIYAGFMYNDLFSLGLNLFGSRWQVSKTSGNMAYYEPAFDAKNNGGSGPYPFGLDPAWHGASNELLFVNSLKMKISVLMGVAQMIVGVVLRWSNAAHEFNFVDFVCEGVPMMVFMVCFFGWMDFMILYKWVTPMDNPPSIINSLICMAMGSEDKAPIFAGSVGLSKMLMFF
jgi:V-type H+-transporting ATPase subunit a